jgi:holo-[acyl-carrier protein] synthase
MLKTSVGIDIEEVDRFRKKPLDRNVGFYNSIFSQREIKYCIKFVDPYPHFAGIFAAKEAVIKCVRIKCRMTNIEICRDSRGKPALSLRTKKKKKKTLTLDLSISHTEMLAIAVVVMIKT